MCAQSVHDADLMHTTYPVQMNTSKKYQKNIKKNGTAPRSYSLLRVCIQKVRIKSALSLHIAVHKVCMMKTLQTLCRLSAELATKSLFEPFWRARRSYSMRSNEPKLCKPRDLARHRQVLKGRSHSRKRAP